MVGETRNAVGISEESRVGRGFGGVKGSINRSIDLFVLFDGREGGEA